jgi:hypothetical protein
MLFCAGAAVCVEVPKPPNAFVVAAVPALVWVEEAGAPREKVGAAGAGVLVVFGAELAAPNKLEEGVLLDVPNIVLGGAALVVFCPSPPKALLCGWALNMDDPPNAGAGVVPFVVGAEPIDAKGLLPPAVKLKPAEGGCGLKVELWLLLAPKAGKDEFVNVLLGVADWAGGKLLVAAPAKALLPPKPKLFAPFVPFSLGAGAEAPKLKPDCCGAAKLALCERPFARALAHSCSARRSLRRPSGVKRYDMVMAWTAMEGVEKGARLWWMYLRKRRLLAGVLWRS